MAAVRPFFRYSVTMRFRSLRRRIVAVIFWTFSASTVSRGDPGSAFFAVACPIAGTCSASPTTSSTTRSSPASG